MSESYLKSKIRKEFQGVNVLKTIQEKIREVIEDLTCQNDIKDEIAEELAEKNELERKEVYKKFGLKKEEWEKIEVVITGEEDE